MYSSFPISNFDSGQLWKAIADFKNWDFPVAGSPTMPMLISPRNLTPSCVVFGMPPTNIHKIPFLISVHPFTSEKKLCPDPTAAPLYSFAKRDR